MLKSHLRITRFTTATFQFKKITTNPYTLLKKKYSKYRFYSPKFPYFYFQTELSLSYIHPCLHGIISSFILFRRPVVVALW
jgi:hypothetical protein